MSDTFRQYLQAKAAFLPAELDHITALATVKAIKKKQYILRAGEICYYHTFICEGCMKLYRLDDGGQEHILKFGMENWWISDRDSLLSGKPSDCYITALEDTHVLQWTNAQFEQLYKDVPAFDTLFKQLVSNALTAIQQRVYAHISETAEQKYQAFLKNYPGLVGRIPLHMIASYLGLTRETLTRLRNPIRSNGASKT
jgi:CRP-like cAMP-binding protein